MTATMLGMKSPDPIDVAVGQRIRDRRRALKLSQATLAEALGVTFQQVQKYERGDNRISASMMARAAKTLTCRVGDLMGESSHGEIGAEARELVAVFERLQPTEAQAVLNLAKAMGRARD